MVRCACDYDVECLGLGQGIQLTLCDIAVRFCGLEKSMLDKICDIEWGNLYALTHFKAAAELAKTSIVD